MLHLRNCNRYRLQSRPRLLGIHSNLGRKTLLPYTEFIVLAQYIDAYQGASSPFALGDASLACDLDSVSHLLVWERAESVVFGG